jgi:predicted transcriptional regulator
VNFNVYIDKHIGEQLEQLAKDRGTTRNALIREALARFLERRAQREWPKVVREFKGLKDAPRFENGRDALRPPAADPLE